MRSALLLVVGACFWQLREATPIKTKESALAAPRAVANKAPAGHTLTPLTRSPRLKFQSKRQKLTTAHPPVVNTLPREAYEQRPYSLSYRTVDPPKSHRSNTDMVTAQQTGSILLGPVRLALFLALMPIRLVLGWLTLLGETLVALCKALPQALALIWRAALLAGMYCETQGCVVALAISITGRCSFLLFCTTSSMQLAAPSSLRCL
jgi:hypothetical protein